MVCTFLLFRFVVFSNKIGNNDDVVTTFNLRGQVGEKERKTRISLSVKNEQDLLLERAVDVESVMV